MSLDKKELERVRLEIGRFDSATILAHEHPDGDAIGAAFGFAIMLSKKGYSVRCSWPEPGQLPEKYGFLPGSKFLVRPDDAAGNGLVIAFDSASEDRLPGFRGVLSSATALVNFDHHPDNTMFGKFNLVDPMASATSEILFLSCEDLGLEMDSDVATCFYTGIMTDTGRFQFGNTSATTLRIAAEMVDMGVKPASVYEQVFQADSMQYIRLVGKVLGKATFVEGPGLVYGVLTLKDLEDFGVRMDETEDLIDNLRSLKRHRVAALLKELADGRFRVSLRSGPEIDVGALARKLGGGGHRAAAGYTSGASGVDNALSELKEGLFELQRRSDR